MPRLLSAQDIHNKYPYKSARTWHRRLKEYAKLHTHHCMLLSLGARGYTCHYLKDEYVEAFIEWVNNKE